MHYPSKTTLRFSDERCRILFELASYFPTSLERKILDRIQNLGVGIIARGTTAHGAYPWKSDNAIRKISQFLVEIENEFPTPKQFELCSTVNVASIRSQNQTYNKIPDQCEVGLDIRFLSGDFERVLERLKRTIPADCTLEIITHEPALYVDKNNLFLTKLKSITENLISKPTEFYCAQGSSDARHYTSVGISGIEFGPIGGGIGTDEEWIQISSLSQYCKVLENFLSIK